MKFLKDKRAETIISTILLIVVFFTLVATFITIFPLFVTKTEVDTIAAQLTRVIELTGQAGSEYASELADLRTATGLDPTVSVHPAAEQYQLREQFTVTVTVNATINIFTPSFGEPLSISVPITKTVTGRSEVYFKP
ncbi:MAG TPA: DUF4320 family protein [Clostridia bacterium]|nr:DUF4320 family protein [Clostridia bacterium]